MSLGQFCIVKLVSSAVLNVVIFGACFDNIGRSRGLAFKMINVFIIKINVFDRGGFRLAFLLFMMLERF